MIKAICEDWARAPISGTLAVLLVLLSFHASWFDQDNTSDHFMIMAMLVLLGRKPNT